MFQGLKQNLGLARAAEQERNERSFRGAGHKAHYFFFYFCAGFELISIEGCWGLFIEIHLHWQLTVQPVEIYFYQ